MSPHGFFGYALALAFALLAGSEVLSHGNMEGGAFDNASAAADLAKKIVDEILR